MTCLHNCVIDGKYMINVQSVSGKKGCFKGCPAIAYEKFGSIDHISETCGYLKHIYHNRLFEKKFESGDVACENR